ncbi:MAG: SH3 domain-containing protein [Stenotrophomonas sp.]|uniref:SH3 domain-containing protein n=1 Tax=Stenotrophomonas sp. TaxID=69392 RepID=UPI003D6CBF53
MDIKEGRSRIGVGVMLLALALAAAPAWAGARDALRFSPANGVQVQADLAEDGLIDVQILPAGTRQRLPAAQDADGQSQLSSEDIDFDGYPDLVARAPVGQVNEAVAVYRYDARQARLTALVPTTHGQEQCGGLMGLAVEAATRTLTSSCRSGPMWYVDVYRYNGPALYLYRAERMSMLGDALDAVVAVKQPDDSGPLAVWSTFDAAGKVLETAIADGLEAPRSGVPLQPVSGRVVPERLALYARPGDTATRRYLVAGDTVALLDERDGWVQVRYANPTHGAIVGWVNGIAP